MTSLAPPPELKVTGVDEKTAAAVIDSPNKPGIGRTPSGGFETKEGTLYVSKPQKLNKTKKLRALITFVPRKSHFDTTNEHSGVNEFRGFFTLFWISTFFFAVSTYIRSWESTGHILNLAFATMFSEDAVTLAISDAILVGCTVICVPFAKLVSKRYIRYYWYGVAMQHLFQTVILFSAVTWTFNRHWPWVQSGFLTLHSLVMIMKMYSYMSINGYLQQVTEDADELLIKMKKILQEHGGWDQALQDANARAVQGNGSTTSSGTGTPDLGTADIVSSSANGTTSAYVDAGTAEALRKRLTAVNANGTSTPTMEQAMQPFPELNRSNSGHLTPHVLVHHPSEDISTMAKDWVELDAELESTGVERIRYPNNITLWNFVEYQLIPTLVYELEYPRTDRIRWGYVFEKVVAFLGTFALLYTVTETFILPLTPTRDQSFWRSLLDLALPFMGAYLLLFYVIFECICNGFAELSRFADRQFYEDWWNSTSWDEFSRKWNKPVHAFLLRHVYASAITSLKVSRTTAMFITFLVSALAHELVMAVVTKKVRMYLFSLQLIQIPLIAMSRLPIVKRNRILGNVVFWLGLYAGFPLLCVAYVAY